MGESREPGWDGELYHRISTPQARWGMRVLERLDLAGDETVADVGCGSGRLTTVLLERLPRGRVVAIDRDASMVREAWRHLGDRATGRFAVLHADASALPLAAGVDVVFSTATFHWVLDARRLYAGLLHALVPGGRFEAQCGGGPNLLAVRKRAGRLMRSPDYAADFTGWSDLWRFDEAETAADDLRAVGFTAIETWIEEMPTPLDNAAAYREWLASMIFRGQLACIRDPDRRAAFLDTLVEQGAADDPPFVLDYWRLNLRAQRPR